MGTKDRLRTSQRIQKQNKKHTLTTHITHIEQNTTQTTYFRPTYYTNHFQVLSPHKIIVLLMKTLKAEPDSRHFF